MAAEKQHVNFETAKEFGLSREEYDKVLDIMGREPNLTELGIFSVLYLYILIYGIVKSQAVVRYVLFGLLLQAMLGGDFTDNRHLLFFMVFRT